MEYKFRFVFQHRKDKDFYYKYWTLDEILLGVGELRQDVREIMAAIKEDGYDLIAKEQF